MSVGITQEKLPNACSVPGARGLTPVLPSQRAADVIVGSVERKYPTLTGSDVIVPAFFTRQGGNVSVPPAETVAGLTTSDVGDEMTRSTPSMTVNGLEATLFVSFDSGIEFALSSTSNTWYVPGVTSAGMVIVDAGKAAETFAPRFAWTAPAS